MSFYFIFILGFKIHMQYLLYCVVRFRVQGTTRKVFVADVLDITLTNHGDFT
jgi:hypothetical protein